MDKLALGTAIQEWGNFREYLWQPGFLPGTTDVYKDGALIAVFYGEDQPRLERVERFLVMEQS